MSSWYPIVARKLVTSAEKLSGILSRLERRPPPALPSTGSRPRIERLRVGAVLDGFSAACFEPDCQLALPRPADFAAVLEDHRPDLVLVESSWRGNQGAWGRPGAMRLFRPAPGMTELVDWCRLRAVPTVFWNKDDPVHFERFVRTAGLFQHVATSDAGCIPAYRTRLGHDRVFVLAFAAQPGLHHPVVSVPRQHTVCYAGSYWADRYEQRRRDLDQLLKPAMDFGLHIFDRNHGSTGWRSLKWKFPGIYQTALRGRLDYPDMVEAYRRYKVFLNVSAVVDSPTMLPRRVFELLACGTPVISSPTRGIVETLGEDAVLFASSEEETRAHLDRLLGDDDAWARRSLLGIRRVLSGHTCQDRLREVCARIGIEVPGWAPPGCAALALPRTPGEVDRIAAALERQTRKPRRLILLAEEGLAGEAAARAGQRLGDMPVVTLPASLAEDPEALRKTLRAAAGLVWMLRPDCFYGARFLEDACLATRYTKAPVMGRCSHHRLDSGRLALVGARHEFRWVEEVPSGSVVARTGALSTGEVARLIGNETFRGDEDRCLSLDRFNFVAGVPEGVDQGRLRPAEA